MCYSDKEERNYFNTGLVFLVMQKSFKLIMGVNFVMKNSLPFVRT